MEEKTSGDSLPNRISNSSARDSHGKNEKAIILLKICLLKKQGGRPRGIEWRGRWEGGSGWGIHVTPWLIHVSV